MVSMGLMMVIIIRWYWVIVVDDGWQWLSMVHDGWRWLAGHFPVCKPWCWEECRYCGGSVLRNRIAASELGSRRFGATRIHCKWIANGYVLCISLYISVSSNSLYVHTRYILHQFTSSYYYIYIYIYLVFLALRGPSSRLAERFLAIAPLEKRHDLRPPRWKRCQSCSAARARLGGSHGDLTHQRRRQICQWHALMVNGR